MSFSMYDASIPMFVRMLNNMSFHLEKAEQHAAAKKFDSANYLGLRLAPDMLQFTRQVLIACDTAKFAAYRLAGLESPVQEDNEKSIADLRGRIAATVKLVEAVPADKIAGSEERSVTFKRRGEPVTMIGRDYLTAYAIPNFFFHVTTAYAILRHNGVELGKQDFLKGANQ